MRAELEGAIQARDALLQMMSHELRTPLNPILGMAEGLQEEAFGSLSDRQKKAVALITKNAQKLLKVVNNLLTLVYLESQKVLLDRQPIVVQDLCNASLSSVASQAQAKGIQLQSHIPSGFGSIQVDGERMHQALVHLLENAVKFTAEGGTVSLEVQPRGVEKLLPPVEVSQPPSRTCIEFSVQDNGIGIAAESLETLFQPFVQIDNQLSRRYGGTGLGLSLVRRLVELHGGHVSVVSQPGQGSCFTIMLPI